MDIDQLEQRNERHKGVTHSHHHGVRGEFPAQGRGDFPAVSKDLPSPVDGIAIATQVREEVYKSNDFWNTDTHGAKKQRSGIDNITSSSEANALPKGRWDSTTSSHHIGLCYLMGLYNAGPK